MGDILYIDRVSGETKKEKVYGAAALELLYGSKPWNQFFSCTLLPLVARLPFFSKLYGALQKSPCSKRKVLPFIEDFQIDASDFEKKPTAFRSFNDFFTRKLKPESRPLAAQPLVIPADGRYLFFPKIASSDQVEIKGQTLSLSALLGDANLAKKYHGGSMMIARLCPTDYHRFHFPCDCTPSASRLINGPLYSVNPIALKKNLSYLTQNKRYITELATERFGPIQYIEVGATYVGSVKQTYRPNAPQKKGAEKGFFEFGGSCIIALFMPGAVAFESDVLTSTHLEMRCLLGQPLGS